MTLANSFVDVPAAYGKVSLRRCLRNKITYSNLHAGISSDLRESFEKSRDLDGEVLEWHSGASSLRFEIASEENLLVE